MTVQDFDIKSTTRHDSWHCFLFHRPLIPWALVHLRRDWWKYLNPPSSTCLRGHKPWSSGQESMATVQSHLTPALLWLTTSISDSESQVNSRNIFGFLHCLDLTEREIVCALYLAAATLCFMTNIAHFSPCRGASVDVYFPACKTCLILTMCDFQMWWILWRACFLQSSPSCVTRVLTQEQELLHDAPVCPFPYLHLYLCPPPLKTGPGNTGRPRSCRALWMWASVCSVRTRGWWSALTKTACKWVDSISSILTLCRNIF